MILVPVRYGKSAAGKKTAKCGTLLGNPTTRKPLYFYSSMLSCISLPPNGSTFSLSIKVVCDIFWDMALAHEYKYGRMRYKYEYCKIRVRTARRDQLGSTASCCRRPSPRLVRSPVPVCTWYTWYPSCELEGKDVCQSPRMANGRTDSKKASTRKVT